MFWDGAGIEGVSLKSMKCCRPWLTSWWASVEGTNAKQYSHDSLAFASGDQTAKPSLAEKLQPHC